MFSLTERISSSYQKNLGRGQGTGGTNGVNLQVGNYNDLFCSGFKVHAPGISKAKLEPLDPTAEVNSPEKKKWKRWEKKWSDEKKIEENIVEKFNHFRE